MKPARLINETEMELLDDTPARWRSRLRTSAGG